MLTPEEKAKLKQVFALVKEGKLREARDLADTLSDFAKNQIPDSILFKFANLQEMSGIGGSAGVIPGTGLGVSTKHAFKPKRKKVRPQYKGRPFRKRLASVLNEVSYSKFKKESRTKNHQQAIHSAVREIKKRISEVNRILEYTHRMRSELSEDKALKYSKFTEGALNQITNMVAELYGNVKKLKK